MPIAQSKWPNIQYKKTDYLIIVFSSKKFPF